ncbi:MAG: hypothetical protein LBQ43_00710 [Holosporales bacterium]|jgi:hypothetical protein|nr:hypothetical protein [Holosporales bacterium]
MHTSPDYDLLEVPGLDNLKIAVLPAMHRSERDDDAGVRTREWTLSMDKIFLPLMTIELFGWYAESERETGTDVGNQLFTSSSLRHSELVVVIPCGMHLTDLENKLASGAIISNVIISRFIRDGGIAETPIQTNTFRQCHITMVQQYLDYIIVQMRISKKQVTCTAYDQDGFITGMGMYDVSFISAEIDAEMDNLASMF